MAVCIFRHTLEMPRNAGKFVTAVRVAGGLAQLKPGDTLKHGLSAVFAYTNQTLMIKGW
jgi:hypothetical protein